MTANTLPTALNYIRSGSTFVPTGSQRKAAPRAALILFLYLVSAMELFCLLIIYKNYDLALKNSLTPTYK